MITDHVTEGDISYYKILLAVGWNSIIPEERENFLSNHYNVEKYLPGRKEEYGLLGYEGIKTHLWDDLFNIHLGAQADLESFLGANVFEGYLCRDNGTPYKLTNKGRQKLNQLTNLMKINDSQLVVEEAKKNLEEVRTAGVKVRYGEFAGEGI